MEVNTEGIKKREMQMDFFNCDGKQRDIGSHFARSKVHLVHSWGIPSSLRKQMGTVKTPVVFIAV